MLSANRCPECRETVHPYAAACPSCDADLDTHRRRRVAASPRGPRLSLPGLSTELTDLVVIALIMFLLAMFAPIYGALFALLIFWHANHNVLTVRRNIAGLCAGLALFNVAFPDVLYLPHLLPFLAVR